MMEKIAQAVRVGGEPPPPFTISTITYKVVVYTPAERADTTEYIFYCKRAIVFLSSSKILTPPLTVKYVLCGR
jgi:hypothetical protein